MRKIFFSLALIAGTAFAAPAPKLVTVQQLEQLLAAVHGQSDGKVAKQLEGLELTERAGSVRLAHWETEFPGRHCREALTELADSSAFLDLPAADIPTEAAPDRETQLAILQKAVEYTAKTITRLPNFYATRTTQHFEDTPAHQSLEHGDIAPGRGVRGGAIPAITQTEIDFQRLHPTGTSSTTVTYRDGHEMSGGKPLDSMEGKQRTSALTSSGEFGPALGMVFTEVTASRISWAHWEQGPTGVAAVFRYSVPQDMSHYSVGIPRRYGIEEVQPAYHGEIAIDPASGDVLRLTVVGDLAPPNDKVRTLIAVEYGSMLIGGKPYICPVKSIAISKIPVGDSAGTSIPMQTQLNDVAFTGYHLFRAESRILTGPDVISGEESAPKEPPGK